MEAHGPRRAWRARVAVRLWLNPWRYMGLAQGALLDGLLYSIVDVVLVAFVPLQGIKELPPFWMPIQNPGHLW
jgi:hypothetical protein